MTRLFLILTALMSVPAPLLAQAAPAPPPEYPEVTLGVLSYLQYSAELKDEADGFNAFDVTRGYINLRARLSDHLSLRVTPALRRVTDASLVDTLTFGLEYAYVEVDVSDNATVSFGAHPTPWLEFEQGINRYRVQGPLFTERVGLIPGPSDIGASVRWTGSQVEAEGGVFNGEGAAQAEFGEHKSVQARVTVHPITGDSLASGVSISGFYSHGWYATDRPRNLAIVMGAFESPHVVGTAQFIHSTDNPFVAADITRRGLSFFGEVRQGPSGWAGLGRIDIFDPDTSDEGDKQRRHIYGGAYWSQVGEARVGLVISLEQVFREARSDTLVENRLLVQTHIEF